MAELTFIGVEDPTVGYTKVTSKNYATARNATNADSAWVWGIIWVGQRFEPVFSDYEIFRMGVVWDTSALGANALIISANLEIRCESRFGVGDIQILNGRPTYPHVPVEVGDYDRTKYSGNGGVASPTGGWGASSTLNFSLTGQGLSWINKTGLTKFWFRSSNDINNIPPTGDEYGSFWDFGGGSSRQLKLIVTYTIQSNIPAVGDPTLSNTKGTYTTATANVSDDGGGYTERGFEYGTSEDAMWATREMGIFTGTGNFSMQISSLVPEKTYYVRAYVVNNFGIGYSNWVSFTTTDVPSYGIYEESNSLPDSNGIYANSNTICFWVRQVGGKWSIKHGPYTSDQIDIKITEILKAWGKGKYQIKFTSDVLTGLATSVMVKLDIKTRS